MKCHYITKKNERYLIPGCWPVVNSWDISDCTCNDNTDRVTLLERRIAKLEKQLAAWEKSQLQ